MLPSIFALVVSTFLNTPVASATVPSGLKPQPLLTIANDKSKKVSTLHILIDGNERVAGLYSQGGDNPDEAHFLKDFEKDHGVNLVERDTAVGKIAFIRLRGKINRQTQEGKGQAIFVSNALFRSESMCGFEIRKKDGKWVIVNSNTKKQVNKLVIRTSRMGVDTIEGLCK